MNSGSSDVASPVPAGAGDRAPWLMRQFSVGSLSWLLAWEALLRWRELSVGQGRKPALRTMLILFVLAHAFVFWLMWDFSHRRRALPEEAFMPVIAMLGLIVFLVSLLQGISITLNQLLDSRDLTLALTSPVQFSRLLTARILSLILKNLSGVSLLLLPVANCAVLVGKLHWLLLYPLALALSAIGVGSGLLILRPILRWFGAVMARRLLQVLQFGIPMSYMIWSAFYRVGHLQVRSNTAPGNSPDNSPENSFSTVPDFAMWLAGAAYGNLAPLLALLLGSATLVMLGRYRIDAVVQKVLLEPEPRAVWRNADKLAAKVDVQPFHGGVVRLMIYKEWRSIVRDSKLLMTIIGHPLMVAAGMLPALWISRSQGAGVVALLVFVSCQIAQTLGTLFINGEQAPELLGAAPVSRTQMLLAKSIAAMLPVAGLALLGSAILLGQSWHYAAAALGCALGGAFSVLALILARPRPVDRRSFIRPVIKRSVDVLDVLGILIVEIGWAVAGYWLSLGEWLGALVVLAILLVPLIQWLRDTQREALLGY